MKLLVIFVTLIVAFTSANNITEDAVQNYAFVGKDLIPNFNAIIENLKKQDKYDPFSLGKRNVHIDDKSVDIKLDGNVFINGLLNIVPKEIKISIIFKYNFELLVPEIELLISDYNLEGSLGGLLKIFGRGVISVRLIDTVIKGTGKVTWSDKEHKFLVIKTFKPDIKFNNFHFLITGYLNDEYRSAMMSKIINNIGKIVLPPLIQQNIGKINDQIEKIVMELSDGVLIPSPL